MSQKGMGGSVRSKLMYRFFMGRKALRQFLSQPVRSGSRPQVVFVAGAQRSGTNMVMDILEKSGTTAVFHERDPRAFHNYELRDAQVLRQLLDKSRAGTTVFKALCESQDVLRLLDAFTPAKAIWVFRRYDHVVASHIKKWKGMPTSIAEIVSDSGGTAGWRGRGMSESTLALVRRLYHPALSNASACALFWYFRNTLYFDQALERDPRVKLISYDQLVSDPGPGAKDLFVFLDLNLQPASYGFVSDHSASEVKLGLEIDEPIREVCEELQRRLLNALPG